MSYADKVAGFPTDANMNHVKVDSHRVFIIREEYQ